MCTTMKPHFTALQKQRKDCETHKSEKSSIQGPLGLFLYLDRKTVLFQKVVVKNKLLDIHNAKHHLIQLKCL